ncbi:hypothetical protein C0J52_26966 [Blattella germanica]|nr:hypothetical protein C0J52_26966 [Blattella germanica]
MSLTIIYCRAPQMRHVTTRLAIYGFHHKMCCNKVYHEPNECVCVSCAWHFVTDRPTILPNAGIDKNPLLVIAKTNKK